MRGRPLRLRQDHAAQVHVRLLPPTSGEVKLHNQRVDGPPERMALVFQEYSRSLFPWLSVRQNVAFPLRRKKLDKPKAKELVENAVGSVDLTGFLDRYPWELSGGMQQRVAIARALAYQPEIMLMDEPFASVDAQTRADLEDLILEIRAEYGVTVVFVTHDIDESVYLSDRIFVLTPSPTQVQEVLDVDLPQPRDQVETKELPTSRTCAATCGARSSASRRSDGRSPRPRARRARPCPPSPRTSGCASSSSSFASATPSSARGWSRTRSRC